MNRADFLVCSIFLRLFYHAVNVKLMTKKEKEEVL